MSSEPLSDSAADSAATIESDVEDPESKASRLGAYDLDGDGHVSPVETVRATLGVFDAHLEQVADQGGVTGKIADAAHHVVDRLDND